jgi:hypothetical protein
LALPKKQRLSVNVSRSVGLRGIALGQAILPTSQAETMRLGKALLVAAISTPIVACADTTSPVTVVPRTTEKGHFAAAYAKVRSDPKSLGNAHNAGLDALLQRMATAKKNLGRRVRISEGCDIFAEYIAEERAMGAPISDDWVASLENGSPGRKHICGMASRVRLAEARLAARGVRSGNVVTSMTGPLTYVDSVFTIDSIWDSVPNDEPSLVVAASLEATIATLDAAIQGGGGSAAGVHASIASVAASLDTASAFAAPWLAEVVGLASSSTEYWEENGEAWLETICDDPPTENMHAGVASARSDHCSESSLAMAQLQSGGALQYMKYFVTADLRSVFSIPLAIYTLSVAGKEFFDEIGRNMYFGKLGFADAVREAAHTFTHPYTIKKAATWLVRDTLSKGAIAMAVIDSAWQTYQYVTNE